MTSRFVQEPNNAQSIRWKAMIAGLESVEFKLVDFTLPMISLGATDLGGRDVSSLVVPGDRLNYDEIQLNFLVDVTYRNYIEVFRWMKSLATANEPEYKDITVHMLDNQGNLQGVSFNYSSCWPILMAPVMLESSGETNDIVMGLTLKYNEMEPIVDLPFDYTPEVA